MAIGIGIGTRNGSGTGTAAGLIPRPGLFWAGVVLIGAGVGDHIWMFVRSAPMHFDMSMMTMSPVMWAAMGAIVVGVLLSAYAVAQPRDARRPAPREPLTTSGRRRLIGLLTFALLVDQMKPATLAFIEPGMADEYHLTTSQVAWFPTVALTGTVVGSLLWGLAADRIGRRATILISSLLFFGTTVCGAMVSFAGNLIMCGMMGVAAGGLLPVVYALMTESLPPGRRAAIMVLQAGLTTTGGYMAASGLAALLIPLAGWRVLWFAQLPLVLVPIFLNHWIPESTAFATRATRTERPPATVLFRHPHLRKTLIVTGYGLAWGLIWWGFMTFLPALLGEAGLSHAAAASLLFVSSLLAIPASIAAAWLYTRWSARGTMALYAFVSVAALVVLAVIGVDGGQTLLVVTAMCLFGGTSGVIALLGPYTAEIFPTHVRGTAGGWAAAVSKSGGAFGPPLVALLLAAPGGMRTASLCVAVPMALAALAVAVRGADPRTTAAEHDRLDAELEALLDDAARPTPEATLE
jgi:MFS transporter, putative metabolite:H+ symporter